MGFQDTGIPGRPVSSGLQVPGKPDHCRTVQEQDNFGEIPSLFFLQNFLEFHQKR